MYNTIRPRILYHVAKAAWEGRLVQEHTKLCNLLNEEFKDKLTKKQVINQIRAAMGLNPHDSEQILTPYDETVLMGIDRNPIVLTDSAACLHCNEHTCEAKCPSGALSHDQEGYLHFDPSRCLLDGDCLTSCSKASLAEKAQLVALISLLRSSNSVYASIAPAFAGQFGNNITFAKLRTALLSIGFKEAVETAIAADFITIKEVFEFDEHVKQGNEYMITSCCCPAWIKLIETKYPSLADNISPSVSPMIASARIIKHFEPTAKVVFIGPCIAKKAEAALPEFKGEVDLVLTFPELKIIFDIAGINVANQPEQETLAASGCGRIYARTGGVSQAVQKTLASILPEKAKIFKPIQADGIPDCIKLLNDIIDGNCTANFIEGMACRGGCVGGPGRIQNPEIGTEQVNDFSKNSSYKTPLENPRIYSILNLLEPAKQLQPVMKEKNSVMAQILSRQEFK